MSLVVSFYIIAFSPEVSILFQDIKYYDIMQAKLLLRSAGVAAAVQSCLQRLQRAPADPATQRALQLIMYTNTVLQTSWHCCFILMLFNYCECRNFLVYFSWYTEKLVMLYTYKNKCDDFFIWIHDIGDCKWNFKRVDYNL